MNIGVLTLYSIYSIKRTVVNDMSYERASQTVLFVGTRAHAHTMIPPQSARQR
jgi:ribosomal protein S2